MFLVTDADAAGAPRCSGGPAADTVSMALDELPLCPRVYFFTAESTPTEKQAQAALNQTGTSYSFSINHFANPKHIHNI